MNTNQQRICLRCMCTTVKSNDSTEHNVESGTNSLSHNINKEQWENQFYWLPHVLAGAVTSPLSSSILDVIAHTDALRHTHTHTLLSLSSPSSDSLLEALYTAQQEVFIHMSHKLHSLSPQSPLSLPQHTHIVCHYKNKSYDLRKTSLVRRRIYNHLLKGFSKIWQNESVQKSKLFLSVQSILFVL